MKAASKAKNNGIYKNVPHLFSPNILAAAYKNTPFIEKALLFLMALKTMMKNNTSKSAARIHLPVS